MADQAGGKTCMNHLQVPIDLLWDDSIPLRTRIYILVTHWRPVPVDTGTLANITRATRKQVKAACAALAKKGLIKRNKGKVTMLVEGLPEADPKGLRAVQGFQGKKTKMTSVPVPLRRRLLAQRRSSAEKIVFRFPQDTMKWLLARDAFDEPAWWAHQLPKQIGGSDALMKRGGWLLRWLMDNGIDTEGLTATECVVTHTVEAAWSTEDRGTTIRSVPAMVTKLLKDAERRPGGDGDDDRLAQVHHRWAQDYQHEPVEERLPVSVWLSRQADESGG